MLTAALVFAAAVYVCAFVEPADAVKLRQFTAALRSGAWLRAADLAPAGLFAAKLAVLTVILFCLTPHSSDVSGALPGPLTAFAALAFMARDIGVIVIFRFGPRPGKGDLSAVLALALLYWIGGLIGRSVGGAEGSALFSPVTQTAPLISLISGAVQAGLAWGLAAHRLRGPAPAVAS